MADLRYASAAASVGSDTCPCVADLINYALGQMSSDDRERVDSHLRNDDCSQCRRWIEKAARFRAEPWPDATPLPSANSANHSSPLVSDQTPIPPSSKWQRQAFHDLEQRLQRLEEG